MTIYELRDLFPRFHRKRDAAASLVNMTDDFREYVERNPNWTFVKSYIDDGKSGLTTRKRKDFLNLLTVGAPYARSALK